MKALSRNEKQEMVEAVVLGMATQGEPAITPWGNCCWKTKDKNRCAVAMLMTDTLIDQLGGQEDGSIFGSSGDLAAHLNLGITGQHFLERLQSCHDKAAVGAQNGLCDFLPQFAINMQALCKRYDLRYPEEYL